MSPVNVGHKFVVVDVSVIRFLVRPFTLARARVADAVLLSVYHHRAIVVPQVK